jgi:hypothetical protein
MRSFLAFFRSVAPVALVLSLGFTACSGSTGGSSTVPTAIGCSSGQTFSIQVFSDALHTQPQCQFNPETTAAAYAYVANVAPSDRYVMSVQLSGACVYMAPQGRKNDSCDSTAHNVTGVQAPGGNLSFTWPLSTSLKAGLYTIAVFDQTTNEELGIVKVFLQ